MTEKTEPVSISRIIHIERKLLSLIHELTMRRLRWQATTRSPGWYIEFEIVDYSDAWWEEFLA
jgi:hypothetical protein